MMTQTRKRFLWVLLGLALLLWRFAGARRARQVAEHPEKFPGHWTMMV